MYDVCAVLQLQNEIIHLRLEMKSLRNEYDTVRQSLSHSDEEKVNADINCNVQSHYMHSLLSFH